MALVIQRPSLENVEKGESYLHVVVFGQSGMGKTPFAAQWPRPLFLMADKNGENSLLRTNTPFVQVFSRKDFDAALTYLREQQDSPKRQFDTVVFDSVSVFQDYVTHEIMREKNIENMEGFKSWGELEAAVKMRLNELQKLRYNIVVTCHINDKFGDDAGAAEPLLKGGMKQSLTREFPIVIGLDREVEYRVPEGGEQAEKQSVLYAYYQPNGRFPMARTPDRALPEKLEVTFTPNDHKQLVDHLVARGRQLLDAHPPVAAIEISAPVEVQQRPDMMPNVSGPAIGANDAVKRAAKKGAAKKAEEAQPTIEESTLEGAVSVVEDKLGGTVVPLEQQLAEARTYEQALSIYQANKAVWTDELSALMKKRIAEEPGFKKN